ncbi:MAG: hypothetical protein H7A34_01330 [bacterium]|nr:hypothetical protein [bacterium]
MKLQTKIVRLMFISMLLTVFIGCSPTVHDKYFLKKADGDVHEDAEDLMGKRPFSLF